MTVEELAQRLELRVAVGGVALSRDVACIVLCEDAPLDEDALARAQEKGIAVLVSEENAYRLASRLSVLI